jgi:hypothetical protein
MPQWDGSPRVPDPALSAARLALQVGGCDAAGIEDRSMDPLRIFLSSPSDVADERALARRLLKD